MIQSCPRQFDLFRQALDPIGALLRLGFFETAVTPQINGAADGIVRAKALFAVLDVQRPVENAPP